MVGSSYTFEEIPFFGGSLQYVKDLSFWKEGLFVFLFFSLWLAVPREYSGKDKQDRSMKLAATLHLHLGSREWVGSGPVTAMEAQSISPVTHFLQ